MFTCCNFQCYAAISRSTKIHHRAYGLTVVCDNAKPALTMRPCTWAIRIEKSNGHMLPPWLIGTQYKLNSWRLKARRPQPNNQRDKPFCVSKIHLCHPTHKVQLNVPVRCTIGKRRRLRDICDFHGHWLKLIGCSLGTRPSNSKPDNAGR